MRLLNTTTIPYRLHEFPSSDSERYAVLSHTWGATNDEVSFVDVEAGLAETKPAYHKIKYACERALHDGYEWIWIDTCCIDKSSSAELSEAINSMYQWYRQASSCYAYLSDVDADVDTSGPQFANCRWFKRGWTLQELIAPSSLIFLSRDWQEVGTKSTMYNRLSAITKIDIGILTGTRDLDSMSVATRMSWAAERQTGRKEDKAYCLMGLFNVNMPMLYGEGDKAFLRLQEQIMRDSDDQSLFAWKKLDAFPDDSSYGLLAESPQNFINSGNIVPYRDFEARAPFSMTNRGLCIDLHLSRYDGDIYVAALDCPSPDNYEGFLGIYLKRLSSTTFCRIRPTEFCKIPVRGSISTVYIRQKIIKPTAHDVYPVHAIQLRLGPAVEDGYKAIRIMTNLEIRQEPSLRSVEPAKAKSWVPQGWSYIFQISKGVTQMAGAVVFQRIDGERIIVVLGSTADFGIAFDVAAIEPGDDVPSELALLFSPKAMGTYMIIRDHRVRVDAETQIHGSTKIYMVDVVVETIEETPNGIIKHVVRAVPRLQQLGQSPQQNGLPKAPFRFKTMFKSGDQKQVKELGEPV